MLRGGQEPCGSGGEGAGEGGGGAGWGEGEGWGRGKREVREGRRRWVAVGRRHEERCEAVHFGLGMVGEGAASRRVVRLDGGEDVVEGGGGLGEEERNVDGRSSEGDGKMAEG